MNDLSISLERFKAHIRTLASDEFEGRAPGSPGERLTVDYLCREFAGLGLEPGINGSYVQPMPMIETQIDPATVLRVCTANAEETLAFRRDMVIGSALGDAEVVLDDSELVFCGYGIVAPGEDWDDYRGVDVRGKTVVLLVNDPGFHTDDAGLFDGRRMTVYGRWPHKFQEAARQGAAAALIIHEDAAAGYGWGVVEAGAVGPRFGLPMDVDPAPRLGLQGWLTGDAAARLFAGVGLDLGALRRAATRRGFAPVPMNARLSTVVRSSVRRGESCNVLGMLRGRERPDEVVAFMAHWDHLGRKPDGGVDDIRRGAVDNGTGVAAVLEIARAFAAAPQRPARSLAFVALTLEESGLLGSQYLVSHLPWSLARTVAVLNFDAMDPDFDNRTTMPLVGYGSSSLDAALAPIVAAQGRRLEDEPEPAKGYFFRSDHYSFGVAGVPGVVAGLNMSAEYARRYHQPSDVYREDWDLAGVLMDVDALAQLGWELADGEVWPEWNAVHPFRVAADALKTERAK
jgi:Zn-dependent M28 family amino/carboxypeptidase